MGVSNRKARKAAPNAVLEEAWRSRKPLTHDVIKVGHVLPLGGTWVTIVCEGLGGGEGGIVRTFAIMF